MLKRTAMVHRNHNAIIHGCESWSMTKHSEKSIDTTGMWFLRRTLRASRTEKKCNEELLKVANIKKEHHELDQAEVGEHHCLRDGLAACIGRRRE